MRRSPELPDWATSLWAQEASPSAKSSESTRRSIMEPFSSSQSCLRPWKTSRPATEDSTSSVRSRTLTSSRMRFLWWLIGLAAWSNSTPCSRSAMTSRSLTSTSTVFWVTPMKRRKCMSKCQCPLCSGAENVAKVEEMMEKYSIGEFSTICGTIYAYSEKKEWDYIKVWDGESSEFLAILWVPRCSHWKTLWRHEDVRVYPVPLWHILCTTRFLFVPSFCTRVRTMKLWLQCTCLRKAASRIMMYILLLRLTL